MPTSSDRFKPFVKLGIVAIAVYAVMGLVTLAVGGFIMYKVFTSIDDDMNANPVVVVSPTSGPPGTVVSVTGTGFGKDEIIDIRFGATAVGRTTANPDGTFSGEVTIPDNAFEGSASGIVATGKQTGRNDRALFNVT